MVTKVIPQGHQTKVTSLREVTFWGEPTEKKYQGVTFLKSLKVTILGRTDRMRSPPWGDLAQKKSCQVKCLTGTGPKFKVLNKLRCQSIDCYSRVKPMIVMVESKASIRHRRPPLLLKISSLAMSQYYCPRTSGVCTS